MASFLLLIMLSSCSNKIDFVEEGVFVKMQLGLASEEDYLEHYPKIITVSNDGTVRLFTENKSSRNRVFDLYVGENPPEIVTQITNQEVDDIKNIITESHFFSLDTDLTDYGVMDGSSVNITVYAKDKERKVGGENPNHQGFSNIKDVIFKHVSDDYYDWREETRKYIYEVNGESLD